MSDDNFSVDPVDPPPPPSPAEQAEAARTRRRWITLAELLGVAAVLISGLTLWNNYMQRSGDEADRAEARREAEAAAREKSAAAQALLLRGTPDRDGGALALAPADAAQTIQDQRIIFPAALGVAPVETVSEPRIEARWFAQALLRALGEAEPPRGDARLAVAIETRFVRDGDTHRDVAIYDLGYRIEGGGLLDGRDVRLRGLARVRAVERAQAQARVDAMWRERVGGAP